MAWNFSPVAGPWLATHAWNYYDYTRDLNFLKSIGYNLLKAVHSSLLTTYGINQTELILQHLPPLLNTDQ